ncbi:MAG: hypothetical protein Q8P67_13810 [archaeon]|nr:hypothetical protein [archaeon]
MHLWISKIAARSIFDPNEGLASVLNCRFFRERQQKREARDQERDMAYFDFEEQKPIVIDNGGHTIKAGWSAEEAPQVVFDNIYGRPRADLRKVDHRPLYVSLSFSFFSFLFLSFPSF